MAGRKIVVLVLERIVGQETLETVGPEDVEQGETGGEEEGKANTGKEVGKARRRVGGMEKAYREEAGKKIDCVNDNEAGRQGMVDRQGNVGMEKQADKVAKQFAHVRMVEVQYSEQGGGFVEENSPFLLL